MNRYAAIARRPRELYRVIGKDGTPLPGLHETIGHAAEAAAFADVTEPNFPYRVVSVRPEVKPVRRVA